MTVAVFFFDDTNFVISSILHVRNYPCLPCTKNKHSVIILKCIFVKIITDTIDYQYTINIKKTLLQTSLWIKTC